MVIRGNEILHFDKVSTVFFRDNYLELLGTIRNRYNKEYETMKKLMSTYGPVDPQVLLDELLELLDFVASMDKELPRAYFFAVLPKDFADAISLILGGASKIEIPFGNKVYRVVGGFRNPVLLEGKRVVRSLTEGEELTIGEVKFKVFSRSCYEALSGPLKSLVLASLLGIKFKGDITLTEDLQLYLVLGRMRFGTRGR
ncbi:MAG: hypothetical protein DRJ49_00195 [Thermoprotei archaeon]|nr:MAG: hypothetical protein DRJ49_00195 [Thermoprotei archaeon]